MYSVQFYDTLCIMHCVPTTVTSSCVYFYIEPVAISEVRAMLSDSIGTFYQDSPVSYSVSLFLGINGRL